MSRQNVELVRRLNEVYNERGFEGDSRDLFDPEFVWDMSRMEVPESVSYSGLPGLRNFLDTWNDGFAAEHVEVEEITDAGDQVVVAIHHTGRGRASGIEVDQRYAMIWTVRAGRAVRMDMYPTREQALQAAELFKVHPEAPPAKPNQDEPVLSRQAVTRCRLRECSNLRIAKARRTSADAPAHRPVRSRMAAHCRLLLASASRRLGLPRGRLLRSRAWSHTSEFGSWRSLLPPAPSTRSRRVKIGSSVSAIAANAAHSRC